jgi:hypothetical protein
LGRGWGRGSSATTTRLCVVPPGPCAVCVGWLAVHACMHAGARVAACMAVCVRLRAVKAPVCCCTRPAAVPSCARAPLHTLALARLPRGTHDTHLASKQLLVALQHSSNSIWCVPGLVCLLKLAAAGLLRRRGQRSGHFSARCWR